METTSFAHATACMTTSMCAYQKEKEVILLLKKCDATFAIQNHFQRSARALNIVQMPVFPNICARAKILEFYNFNKFI
jgi:hypothetical protein